MKHVDVTGTRDMGSAPLPTILRVLIPYASNINNNITAYNGGILPTPRPSLTANLLGGSTGSSNGNSNSGSSSNSCLLVKPTLDPSLVRLCPEECWVPDAQVVTCMGHGCDVSFSLFNRKHHCRLCGRLFCAACCSHAITLRNHHSTPRAYRTSSWTEGVEFTASPLAGLNLAGDTPAGGDPSSSGSFRLCQSYSRPPSPLLGASPTTHRICSACYYEIQLVVPRRDGSGEVRRRCRGELKMCQWSLLVRVLSYLSMHDLLEASRVSADFYFMSRDNVIWYQYNMTQRQQEEMQLRIPMRQQSSTLSLRMRFLQRQKEPLQTFRTDFGNAFLTDASERVISLHARYNFTQFLDFVRRKEMARCRGLSSFSAAARTLFSSPLKIAIIGSAGVGKTLLVRHFVGSQESGGKLLPTTGFVRYEKMVRLTGSATAHVMLHIYDTSGEPRFEELRRFICSNCHAVGLCYDPCRKVTLVEAADVMMGVEGALGPQPVVVCGILRPAESVTRETDVPEVTNVDASGVTVRGRGTLQCTWNNCNAFFQQLVQSLLDRLAMATAPQSVVTAASTTRSANDEKEALMNRSVAQELLRIALDPSPIDVLMDKN
ncbi:putative small GTP-binding protein Rab7 [Trypanosoma rangeli]|uniref:Putative small GTP-binding protein Rab7 n=1 Tax=Trypanosoma rangeli TaxID=5698 RepID=A0A3R7LJV9_TRYRA|nr:putative small GTP-binding protein Rab7 [Trypanosoma rangeli]RNE98722.1 putative small GTP-binding protein Rab7 [Trypanosoma rangeli]|eukprot:RNE98722.1 putative small GTP-binding protein Rab7 [Trypanosoma rangeli]